jgi:hypothetical protein
MKRIQLTIVLLGLMVVPLCVSAQPPAEGPGRDRARTFLVLRIADALKLNEQEALKVSNVIRQSDDHRRELVQRRQTLEQRLREALAKQPLDAPTLTTLITEGNDIDQKLAMVPEESFRELQKILTVEQQAKLMLFRRELQGEIRRALQGHRPAGGRKGRGAAGGPPSD